MGDYTTKAIQPYLATYRLLRCFKSWMSFPLVEASDCNLVAGVIAIWPLGGMQFGR